MNKIKNELNEVQSLGNPEVNVLIFELKSALRIVSISCAIGLIIGILAFIKTPDRYEATAILSLAQTLDLKENNIFRSVGIQNTSLLILKLRDEIPTSEILGECVDQNQSKSAYKISDLFSIAPVKEADYLIQVKNFINSPNDGTRCLESFIDYLINKQYDLQKNYISKLEKMKEFKYDELKELQENNFGKEADMSNKYSFVLLNLESKYIKIAEITQIKNSLNYINENGPKYFTKPIILKSPPTNNRANKILGGFFGGALLGILIVFGRKAVYRFIKTEK